MLGGGGGGGGGVIWAVHVANMYIRTHTQHVRGVGVFTVCLLGRVPYVGVVWGAVGSFFRQRSCSGRRNSRPSGSALPPSASASMEAGQTVPPPRPPTPPSEGRGHSGESEGVPHVVSCEVSSPPSCRLVGRGGVLASGGASDSAASSLPGVRVAGSSRSQGSPVLAAPSSVASSVSAECGRRSRSSEIGESTEDHSHSRSSRSSPSQGRDSHEERRCARSRSGGSCDRSRKSRFRSTDCSQSRGRRRSRRDSSRSPSARVRSRQSGRSLGTATSPVEFARTHGVTIRSPDECAHVCLAVARPSVTGRGHTGPTTGRVTVAGHGTVHPFPLTVRGLGRGVGGLSGVAEIARRQLLPPGIAATLGRGWSLPLL